MGGGIAQSFALASPDRLAGLILVGTGARLRVHPDIFATTQRDMAEAGRLLSQWAYSPSALPATVAQAALAFARDHPGGGPPGDAGEAGGGQSGPDRLPGCPPGHGGLTPPTSPPWRLFP